MTVSLIVEVSAPVVGVAAVDLPPFEDSVYFLCLRG